MITMLKEMASSRLRELSSVIFHELLIFCLWAEADSPKNDKNADESMSGLGFSSVVMDLRLITIDFETCPNYQNCLKFTNKSATESQNLRS